MNQLLQRLRDVNDFKFRANLGFTRKAPVVLWQFSKWRCIHPVGEVSDW